MRQSCRCTPLAKVIALKSMALSPGLVEKIAGAIRSGKLKASPPNPVAKTTEAKPSGLEAKGPSKTPVTPADRVVSRLGAGRTAQDRPQPTKAGAVAIPKRGRPRKLLDQLSRASRYRRKKELEK